MSVPAPFVWRCLSGSAVAPFPHPPHRTGHADFPHPALGQDFTPSFACDAIGPDLTTLGASRVACAFLVYVLPPLPRGSGWASSSLSHLAVSAFPDNVVGSACTSSFSRIAQRSLALRPAHSRGHLLHRRLQPFCHLHDCSGCFRLERLAGWGSHPLESAALARRTRETDIVDRAPCVAFGR
jgi:hypothetical protein